MNSKQIALLAQALGPGHPGAPAQHNGQCVSLHPEAQQCCMQRALRGCITKGRAAATLLADD